MPSVAPSRDAARGHDGVATWFGAHAWDAGLGVVAVGIMLPTCWYRYGIDQALYHYVGSGLLHGLLPYRDAFDVKPPAIYVLYALALRILGPAESSIRVFEILCVLAVSWAAARFADVTWASDVGAPGSDAPHAHTDGVAGIGAVLLASFHAIGFGFWDTAQVELWEGAFVVFAFVMLHGGRGHRRVVWAGALASVAVLFKLTAILPVSLLVLVAAHRATAPLPPGKAWLARSMAAVSFCVGLALPIVVTVGYFAVRGGLPALREWLGYLPYYASAPLNAEWVTMVGPEAVLARGGIWYGVFAALGAIGFFETRRGGGSRATLAVAMTFLLFALAVLSIVVQRRYLSYHSAVLGPFLVLLAAVGIRAAVTVRRELASIVAVCVAAGGFLSAPPWTGSPSMSYRTYVWHVWLPHVLGRVSGSEFDAAFIGPFDYSYATHAALAELIRKEHPEPGDRLHVRGFDPVAYVLTGLYSPSRFMMEAPLDDGYLRQYQPAWAVEHARALHDRPPRFFVARVSDMADLEGLRAGGYGFVGSRGKYVLLERGIGSEPVKGERLEALRGSTVSVVLGSLAVEADLDPSGRLVGRAGEQKDEGKWRISSRDELCVWWRHWLRRREECALLFERRGAYAAFESGGKELGTLRVVSSASERTGSDR